MNTGIYKIQNTANGKFYIGSCASVRDGIRGRWTRHKRELNQYKHHSLILQNAWDKYGRDSFIFEIIEECKPEQCLEREQYYLDDLQPAYNICKQAANCLGVKRSKATKELISAMRKGAQNPMYGQTHHLEAKKRIGASSSQRHQGSNNPYAKLTEEDVRTIRIRLNIGEPQQVIATEFNVNQAIISRIKTRKIWRHI